jgi:hypothetical protein
MSHPVHHFQLLFLFISSSYSHLYIITWYIIVSRLRYALSGGSSPFPLTLRGSSTPHHQNFTKGSFLTQISLLGGYMPKLTYYNNTFNRRAPNPSYDYTYSTLTTISHIFTYLGRSKAPLHTNLPIRSAKSRNLATSQPRNLATSQHRNLATSHSRIIVLSHYRTTASSYHPNIRSTYRSIHLPTYQRCTT